MSKIITMYVTEDFKNIIEQIKLDMLNKGIFLHKIEIIQQLVKADIKKLFDSYYKEGK